MNYAEEPQYEHDCTHCKFLVHLMGRDLYCCPGSDINIKGRPVPNIVIRRSNEPSDYSSGFSFSTTRAINSSFQQINDESVAFSLLLKREAFLRGILLGYIKPEDDETEGPPIFCFCSPKNKEDEKIEFALACLANVGIDIECGACCEIAFTGCSTHKHTCKDYQEVTISYK